MRGRIVAVLVLLVAHVGATAWIATAYRRSHNPCLLMAVAALPLAQVSLLATWGIWQRGPSYLRGLVVAIAVTALWFVECRSLNLELPDFRCAAYAATFAVQSTLVGGLLAATCLGGWLTHRRRNREKPTQQLQFGVLFILGWVTTIALVLGTWKLVLTRARWPLEVVETPLILFGGIVGTYHAMFALLVLAAVWWGRSWQRLLIQTVMATALVCAAAASQQAVLTKVCHTDGNVEGAGWVILAGFQTLYLLITLVPLRLAAYNRPRETDHGTSTRLSARQAGLPDTA